ncbi:hypothetical protein [Enterococcus rivorum]
MKNAKRFGLGLFLTVGFMLNVGLETKADAASLYVESTDVPNETTVLATQNWQDYLNK